MPITGQPVSVYDSYWMTNLTISSDGVGGDHWEFKG